MAGLEALSIEVTKTPIGFSFFFFFFPSKTTKAGMGQGGKKLIG